MKLNPKQLVTIDFETYWAADFSLSSKHLNTSEYIRDPQFMAHCCAIKIGNGKTRVVPGNKLKAEFAKIDWANSDLLAHNCAFDAAILAWHYGHVPRRYFDTLSMTRGLHADMTRASLDTIAKFYGIGAKSTTYLTPTKGLRVLTPEIYAGLAEGCEIDNDLCYEVFKKQVEVFPDDELDLIDMTMRMFVEPSLEVDVPRAEKALEHEMNARLRALALSRVDEKTLNSSPKFAQALRDVGCEPPMKYSAKQGCMDYAFAKNDPDFIELLDHEDIRVVRLVQGRLAAKSTIVETRAYRLIKAGADGQKLPVLLNYAGAKTLRWSGGNKLNLQNLNRQEYDDDGTPVPMTGELRKSIIAPKNHVVGVADSAQIEARVLAWLAGQDDLVEAFRSGEDIYKRAAALIYAKMASEITKDERFVGKVSILGLGYGMGAPKFRTTLALGMMGPPVHLPISLCKTTVNTYRKVNDKIPALWKEAEGVLKAMAAGKEGDWGILSYDTQTVWLPNGMGLHYPGLRAIWDGEKNRVSGYEYLANGHYKKIYGGLLVENCIAEGTLVLTNYGWCPIEGVKDDYLVHDGIDFVRHGGLVTKSVQPCVSIDGVYMTADHEVLTDEGWKPALEKPRPYRPDVRNTDRLAYWLQRRKEDALGIPVWLRKSSYQSWGRRNQVSKERADTKLRMPDQGNTTGATHNPRHEQASSLRRLAQHAGSLPTTLASSLGKLWRTRHQSLRGVGERLRSFLGRHGEHVPAWAVAGPQGQRRAIQQEELPLDHSSRTSAEPARLSSSEHTPSFPSNGDTSVDSVLPAEARLVFDILNAGPLQRFVVLGDNGPFVVHNCVQALARIIVSTQMLETQDYFNTLKLKKDEIARIASMSHDEIISVVPTRLAKTIMPKQLAIMRVAPAWAEGLPLNAEGGFAVNYSK